jgi:hypothetical protein
MVPLFKLLDRMEVRREKSCPMIIPHVANVLVFCRLYSVSLSHTTAVFRSYPQSTYRGRGEIGAEYLPSQLECTLCATTFLVMGERGPEGGRAPPRPPPSPGWADFTIMMECTPEIGHCHSVYSVVLPVISLLLTNTVSRRCELAYSYNWRDPKRRRSWAS